MLKILYVVSIFFIFTCNAVYSQDCFTKYGHGYCTDYILSIYGDAPSGDAKTWIHKANVSPNDIHVGDVAIFDFGTYGHVALIEQVHKDSSGIPESIDVSEWNYGGTSSDLEEQLCAKTTKFGEKTSRSYISISTVAAFWRSGNSGNTSKTMSANIPGGKIEWQTKNTGDSCENGAAWRVTYKWSNESFMTNSSLCPKACYEDSFNLNEWMDFFIRPTYAVNNICASEVPGNPPLVAGPVNSPGFPKEPGPVATTGPRVDLLPDFDVFSDREEKNEISANCNNSESCWATTVDPGQMVFLRLETQVYNADADNFKRKDSKTIEGPIWWRIEGKTDWEFIGNSADKEFDINNLKKCGNNCDHNRETTDWIIPNYPGDILDLKAAVDGDDEIEEEGEGGDHDIDNPDKNCITNNCSRIERFYIRPPAPPPHNDDSTGTTENSGCSETGSTLPTCESNAAAIIPIITDFLLADPELTINIKGKGIVTSTPAGIKCPGACVKDFNDQKVILTAKPKKGHVFVGWSEGCGLGKKKNVCQLDLTEDRVITATFKKQ